MAQLIVWGLLGLLIEAYLLNELTSFLLYNRSEAQAYYYSCLSNRDNSHSISTTACFSNWSQPIREKASGSSHHFFFFLPLKMLLQTGTLMHSDVGRVNKHLFLLLLNKLSIRETKKYSSQSSGTSNFQIQASLDGRSGPDGL